MGTIIVRIVDFKDMKLRGGTVMNDEGDYNVYINARYSLDVQRKALQHELQHINRGDFCSDVPIELVEIV